MIDVHTITMLDKSISMDNNRKGLWKTRPSVHYHNTRHANTKSQLAYKQERDGDETCDGCARATNTRWGVVMVFDEYGGADAYAARVETTRTTRTHSTPSGTRTEKTRETVLHLRPRRWRGETRTVAVTAVEGVPEVFRDDTPITVQGETTTLKDVLTVALAQRLGVYTVTGVA